MTTFALVSVYDKVAETFGRPFCAANKPSAVRSFGSEVNNAQSGMLYDRPADFDLVYLGDFDDQKGAFTMADPHVLANGRDLKAADQSA